MTTLRKHWHAKLAEESGWESEPDEGRRTKTRFARHYDRGTVDRPGEQQLRPRSHSLETGRPKLVKTHDLIPVTMTDAGLWSCYMEEALADV